MSTPVPSAPASPRLLSLDALRGFDMFWILGADALFTALAKVFDLAPLRLIAGQLHHKDWAGFAFYDLILPLFVFMSGVSLVFALPKIIEQQGRAAAVKRVLFRGALLFAVGLFYAGGLQTKWPDIRVLGVLQRIALAYTGAGLLFCFFKPRALAVIGTAILVGYWALLTFVPIRDVHLERTAVSAKLGVAKPTLEQAQQLYASTTARVAPTAPPRRAATSSGIRARRRRATGGVCTQRKLAGAPQGCHAKLLDFGGGPGMLERIPSTHGRCLPFTSSSPTTSRTSAASSRRSSRKGRSG